MCQEKKVVKISVAWAKDRRVVFTENMVLSSWVELPSLSQALP